MVISLRHLRALILARKYDSPRTVSVEVLTLPVAAELTLPTTVHVQYYLEVATQRDCCEERFCFASRWFLKDIILLCCHLSQCFVTYVFQR